MGPLAEGVAAPPSSYAGLTTGLAVLMLVIEFGMLQATLLRAQVRLYAAQSVVISILAVVVAFARSVPELYGLAAFSVLLKVVAVPLVMLRLLRRTNQEIAASRALGVASMVLLAVAVAAFGFFASARFGLAGPVLPAATLAVAVAIVLVSFVLMIVRRDVVSQAIGFFALENGVSLASMVVAAGLPLILEVVFLFDLLVAVVVFAVLIRVHHEQAESLSTETLTELRG
ncbi:MAG TPA: hydrogenase [Pseudonocardiaceae bacterium]|jgi:hydrogenase-4 component E|nr:hydrogenase [Pseudonocardiaceae bacterium]